MTTKRHKRASKQGNRATKRRKSKNGASQAAIQAPRSLPTKPSTVVSMLLQPPKNWTPRHLQVARLKLVDNALPSTIADDLPRDVDAGLSFCTRLYRRLFVRDRDQAFERAAAFFCQPSREGIIMGDNISNSNPFITIFSYLNNLRRHDPSTSLTEYSNFILTLVNMISSFEVGSNFFLVPQARIHFQIPGLLARGMLQSHGAYVKAHGDETTSIPLVIFSFIDRSKTDRENLACYEIPQALLQTVLAYSHNQQLGQYTEFVITVDRTILRVSKVVASQTYLRSLCAKQPVKEELIYYRSTPFELLEREDRREFLRVLFGVLRYSADSDASGMASDQVLLY